MLLPMLAVLPWPLRARPEAAIFLLGVWLLWLWLWLLVLRDSSKQRARRLDLFLRAVELKPRSLQHWKSERMNMHNRGSKVACCVEKGLPIHSIEERIEIACPLPAIQSRERLARRPAAVDVLSGESTTSPNDRSDFRVLGFRL